MRQRRELLENDGAPLVFEREGQFAIGRDSPKELRPRPERKFVARMILREAAIALRVLPAPRAGMEVRNQFFQLNPRTFCFHPDQESPIVRSHDEIESCRRRVMLRAPGLKSNMLGQPTPLIDQADCSGNLANIFPQQPGGGATREERVKRLGGSRARALEQIALETSSLIRLE